MTSAVNTLASIPTYRQSTVGQASATAGKQSLSQTDFLKLLTAQLKDQDPTKPVDNDQLVSQLAQLSTVDGINNLNKAVTAIAGKLDQNAVGPATGLIGRTVLVPGDTAARLPDGTVAGGVDLPAAADDVSVTVKDMTGKALRVLDLGPQPTGLAFFTWDGLDASGKPAPGDNFQLSAASRRAGVTTTRATQVYGRVSGIDLTNAAAPTLGVDGIGPTPLASVRRVVG